RRPPVGNGLGALTSGNSGSAGTTAAENPRTSAPRQPRTCDTASSFRQEISKLPNSDKYEYGAIIYLNPDGSIGYTTPVTSNLPNNVNISGDIPDGATVIGEVHSHPYELRLDPNAYGPSDRDLSGIWDQTTRRGMGYIGH